MNEYNIAIEKEKFSMFRTKQTTGLYRNDGIFFMPLIYTAARFTVNLFSFFTTFFTLQLRSFASLAHQSNGETYCSRKYRGRVAEAYKPYRHYFALLYTTENKNH